MADLTGMMQAAAGAGGGGANYIEDVFSCFLYTGNGTTQTITNNIDLSTKGGLVWIKGRDESYLHNLYDTARGLSGGFGLRLQSNSTSGQAVTTGTISSFNTDGFSIDDNVFVNNSLTTFVSWTFREQANFFDVVTWTGSGVNRTIAHNLGSVPGCIIVKRTDTSGDWQVYHRANTANPETDYLVLNSNAATADSDTRWNDTQPTAAVFSLGTEATVNNSGGTYVAYLFAHDAGGFGLSGEDNVVSCGVYTGNGTSTGPLVTLGYEPQWVMVKNTDLATEPWLLLDSMRGANGGNNPRLVANTDVSEAFGTIINFNATGFTPLTADDKINGSGHTYIYVAIRRGPMAVPTVGTSVFGLSARTGTGADATVTGSAGVSDAVLVKNRGSAVASLFSSRLTGTGYLVTSSQAAEAAAGITILQANPWDVMDGVKVGTTSTITNASANTFINYLFKRAPSFFDQVCYIGTSSGQTINHNLGVIPELMIVKRRNAGSTDWFVWTTGIPSTQALRLNTTGGTGSFGTIWGFANPPVTSTTFNVGGDFYADASGGTFVNYLFATCAGVSKVGSYIGTGTTLQIDCGFTSGARFVLIKSNGTGDWYVWDSARGIIAGDDPYWLTNSDAAEVTNTDYIDTAATGFELTSTAPAAINAFGGTFIFLAIA
tara:strand:- start:968 stop:2944 length:1977 start_codon:yes stop_codon:yes gene_type:complete